jgi:hypothetical protein
MHAPMRLSQRRALSACSGGTQDATNASGNAERPQYGGELRLYGPVTNSDDSRLNAGFLQVLSIYRTGILAGSCLKRNWNDQGKPYLSKIRYTTVPEQSAAVGALQSQQADVVRNIAPDDEETVRSSGIRGTGRSPWSAPTTSPVRNHRSPASSDRTDR